MTSNGVFRTRKLLGILMEVDSMVPWMTTCPKFQTVLRRCISSRMIRVSEQTSLTQMLHETANLATIGWFLVVNVGHIPTYMTTYGLGTKPSDLYLTLVANSLHELVGSLERRETRKVGQREEKRTREAGTKMQCSTW